MDLERALPAVCLWKYGKADYFRHLLAIDRERLIACRVGPLRRIPREAYEPGACLEALLRPKGRGSLSVALGAVSRAVLGPLTEFGSPWLLNSRIGYPMRMDTLDGRSWESVLPPHEAELASGVLSALIPDRFSRSPERVTIPPEVWWDRFLGWLRQIVQAARKKHALSTWVYGLAIAAALVAGFWLGPSGLRSGLFAAAIVVPIVLLLLIVFAAAFFVGLYSPVYLLRALDFDMTRRRILGAARPRPAPGLQGATVKQPMRLPALGWFLRIAGGLVWLPAGLALFFLYSFYQFSGEPPTLALTLVTLAALVPALGLPPLIYLGYRLCLRPAEAALAGSRKAPVLYLRAFDDDGYDTFNPGGVTAYVLGLVFPGSTGTFGLLLTLHPLRVLRMIWGNPLDTAEEQLAWFFGRLGPFVAIGKPGEKLALGGAARVYVQDDSWKQTVLETMSVSQVIVLQPAETQGVWWEIDQILARIPPQKLLLSLINFRGRQARYTLFRLRFERVTGRQLPRCIGDGIFCRFDSEWMPQVLPARMRTPFLWPMCRCVLRFRATLRPFLESLAGRPAGLPEHDSPGWRLCSQTVAVALWLGVFFALCLTSLVLVPPFLGLFPGGAPP